MKAHATAAELSSAIQTAFDKYIAEFDDIPETLKNIRADEADKTPSEHLPYQLCWTGLLQRERDEQTGKTVRTPADGYRWNNLGGLYHRFYQTYGTHSLAEQRQMLESNVAAIRTWLENLSETELFGQDQRRCASSTAAKWPLWRWVHINTVAPFTNFRSKIRKWKKTVAKAV